MQIWNLYWGTRTSTTRKFMLKYQIWWNDDNNDDGGGDEKIIYLIYLNHHEHLPQHTHTHTPTSADKNILNTGTQILLPFVPGMSI